MGKKSAPKAPNTSKQQQTAAKLAKSAIASSERQQAIADEQLEYFKQRAEGDRAIATPIITEMADLGSYLNQTARKYRDRFENVYQPLEDELIARYREYDTGGRRDLERGRRMADVAQQYEGARQSATRQLEGYGINPAATRYAALDLGARTQEAAAKAAAANEGERYVDEKRDAYHMAALDLGGRYPAYAQAAEGMGLNAGNSAIRGTTAMTQNEAATQGTAPQYSALGANYLNAGTSANRSGADIALGTHKAQMDAYNAQTAADQWWVAPLSMAAGAATKAFLAADGGVIPSNPSPHAVPASASPSGGAKEDDVHSVLTAGEFVFPEDVTRWIGEKKLQEMIVKTREERAGAGAKPKMKNVQPQQPTYASPGSSGAIPMKGMA